MEISFSTRYLRQCFEDYNQAERRWGRAVARKYIQRINLMLDTQDFNYLSRIRSLRLHPLSGQRTGQFAIYLNRNWRVILTYDEDEESIHILEVTNHYDD